MDDDCNPNTLDNPIEENDMDGDGFTNQEDCDDTNAEVNPSAQEIPYNGIDEDCNPNTPDDDLDGDGFNNNSDCNDDDASINPNAVEIPNNGMDDDCNPNTSDNPIEENDMDGDGFTNQEDCDDTNAEVNPSAQEIPYNGIDDDCNPNTPDDDLDGDGFNNNSDCNDDDASINPNAEEIPNNGMDDDCNPDTLDVIFENANESPDEDSKFIPNTLIIYPNPASQTVYFGFPEEIEQFQISIFDQKGRLVSVIQNKNVLRISGLSQGTYTVILQNLVTYESIVKNMLIVR